MKKTIQLLLIDTAILFCAALVSQYLVCGHMVYPNWKLLLTFMVLILGNLFLSSFYRVKLSYSSVELIPIALLGMVPASFAICVFSGFNCGFRSEQIRWAILFCLASFFLILGSRAIFRLLFTNHSPKTNLPTAIVYGAGEIGSTIARVAQKGRYPYSIVGFIDDNETFKNELVIGIPVLGTLDDLDRVLSNQKVSEFIIAITNIDSKKVQKATLCAKQHGLEVKIVPNLFETNGNSNVSVRDINYSDLLGRKLITIEKEPLFEMFQDKTILVTGAGGSIGSEICRQIIEFNPKKLVLLDIDETELHDLSLRLLNYEHEWSDKVVPVVCDIKNAEKIENIFEVFKPDLVFHAAAYKHVPLMEIYPEEAILTNITGSYNVFKSASKNNVNRVVVISTDKAVNPTNIMGATKRVVEMIAASFNSESNTDFCCVRFGNVIGSRGSMLPLFLEEIKAGKPITVTDRRIIRYFMAIPEAVSLVFRAGTLAKGGEVMVLDMGEPVNIYDFAQKLIDIFGDGRSQIKITGLRPGEKLYEELLANKDNTIPTINEKIFKAKVANTENWTVANLEAFIKDLKQMSQSELVTKLQTIVPEFHRNTDNNPLIKTN